jgi:broad specificity phosphatase PhoE
MRDFGIDSGAVELLLIRHAQAEHPRPDEANDPAKLDLPLTPRGRVQARALAERLTVRSIGGIYTSPLRRTRETAAIVAGILGLGMHEDARLREVEIGEAGSVSLDDLAQIAIAHGGWSHIKGTESSQTIRERMRDAIDEIVEANPRRRVAIFSHAGAINAYIASILGLSSDFFFPAGNTSISAIRAREHRRLLVSLNDIAHLEALRRAPA